MLKPTLLKPLKPQVMKPKPSVSKASVPKQQVIKPQVMKPQVMKPSIPRQMKPSIPPKNATLVKEVLTGRNDYPVNVLKIMKRYGGEKIKSIMIKRTPVSRRNATFAQNKGDYRNYQCKINIENYMK